MKLSTRTRYGIRAILELANHYGQGPLQIKIIAQRQDISIKYLEQLMSILKSGGFIRSIRGSKGGYLLAEPPEKIVLRDIFNCLEGPITTTECVDDQNTCAKAADCVTREVWGQVQEAIQKILGSITLEDLANRAKEKSNISYHI